MKKFYLNESCLLLQKFLSGEISEIIDRVIPAEGKEWVKQDGRYFEFSDGDKRHCRHAVGDSVAIAMSYAQAGMDEKVFGQTAGWRDRSRVNASYMPHHAVIEGVKCVRVQDLTEEDALRIGLRKNSGGTYFAGGAMGGFNKDWRVMFRGLFDKVYGEPYDLNPWVIVYEVTPVVGRA